MTNKSRNNVGVTQKVFIFNNEGKILIIRRTKAAPSKPNAWDLPGGGIDIGEDPTEAMHREIKEETGIEVEDLKPIDTASKIDKTGEFWVTIGYSAKAKSTDVQLSHEHDDLKWVTPETFLDHTDSKRFLKFLKKL